MASGFMKDFKRFFQRGLLVLLPTLLTLILIVAAFKFVDTYFGRYVDKGTQWVVVQFWCLVQHVPLGPKGDEQIWTRVKDIWSLYHLSWISFVLSLVVVYFIGRFAGSFLGKGIWRQIELTFRRTPIVRAIFPYVKQVTDFIFSERRLEFSRVVAVEYPRKGVWAVGLVTGAGMQTLKTAMESEALTVFIPSSPTPMTGYTVTVMRDDVIDLPLSIDEAIRFTVTAGVVMPVGQELSREETEKALRGRFPSSQSKEIEA